MICCMADCDCQAHERGQNGTRSRKYSWWKMIVNAMSDRPTASAWEKSDSRRFFQRSKVRKGVAFPLFRIMSLLGIITILEGGHLNVFQFPIISFLHGTLWISENSFQCHLAKHEVVLMALGPRKGYLLPWTQWGHLSQVGRNVTSYSFLAAMSRVRLSADAYL